MSRKPGDKGPEQREEDEAMRRLAAFVGQMRGSKDFYAINWTLLPQDTGNRVIYSLTHMPAVRIQVTDEVPNRDAFITFKDELRQNWGVYATFESMRLCWDLRGRPTTANDLRVTVVTPAARNMEEIRRFVSPNQFSLHVVDKYESVPEVIAQIKGVVRSWLASRYV